MTCSGFGALPVPGGVRFRIWAPAAAALDLILHDGAAAGSHPMPRDAEGVFDRTVDKAGAGDRYRYRIDEGNPLPDPASRFQPDGVHEASQVDDPAAFAWSDAGWSAPPARDLILYELHVGTFSPEGTFAGATALLPKVRDLGVTAIELMPVADFPGARNWGYDGVLLYAPARAYGCPDDLRRLVDEAHRLGLAVLLDVVYNHLGPEGAYLSRFNPQYFSDRHVTPWGAAVNLDGEGSGMVRRFITDSARHWVREYHMDGLRLDATHALIEADGGAMIRDIAAAVRRDEIRPILIHAEDDRNLSAMIEDAQAGGWGLDGVWADDFHHILRRGLAGDSHGYFADFSGTASELARTVVQGWLFTGQASAHLGRTRGTDPSAAPMHRFVVCLQNHDQIGNRAMGDRLNMQVPADAWRAASAVLLTAPMTPLIFMGQEWAAGTPFQYFTDHAPELGRLVTEGRRKEFAAFPDFSNESARRRIPDPQSPATFEASRLRWEERGDPAHKASLALYRTLIALRLEHHALGASDERQGEAFAPDADTLVVRRRDRNDTFLIVARLRGGGDVDFSSAADVRGDAPWDVILTTEEPLFALDPAPPAIDQGPGITVIRFRRPGAVILGSRRPGV